MPSFGIFALAFFESILQTFGVIVADKHTDRKSIGNIQTFTLFTMNHSLLFRFSLSI
jgi:hypothetical protein